MYSEIKFSNLSISIKKQHAKVGRPSRPESHEIHEFVATNILAIYVSFLISCAPTNWSTRQLNHHLFGVKTKPLTKKTPVIDGLGHLRARKSIPRLTSGQAISEGIQRAEKEPRFAGGLQILYHPYVHALSGQHNLSTLHTLLALLPWARTAKFIHATADGIVRTTRTAETEIEAISSAIRSMDDQAQRQRMHLDVISTALLLAQEAVVMADHQRLRCWQSWFKQDALLFEHWNVGDKQARQALDRWVQLRIESLIIRTIDPLTIDFEYLVSHVFAPDEAEITENGDTSICHVGPSGERLFELMCAIRRGQFQS